MKKTLSLLMAGALLTTGLATGGVARANETDHVGHHAVAPANPKGEARIARTIQGRTAGAPVDCITQQQISSSEIIDRTAIVYRMNNGTIYVNRPPSGANFLRSGTVMVTDTRSTQLCGIDIVRLFDNSSRMSAGSIGLGKFVPYPRPAR